MRSTVLLARVLAISVFLFVIAGIARSNGNTPRFEIPAIGTRFFNIYYVKDSSDRLVPDSIAMSPMVPDEQVVVAAGVKAHGRSNCIVLLGPLHPDTTFISFAKNGDLYVLHHLERDSSMPSWEWLPFSLQPGKVLKTKPVREVYFKNSQRPWTLMHRRELEVLGNDTVSVSGKVFDCIKLRAVEIRSEDGIDYKNAFTYWYSPEIGYFLRLSFGWNGPYFMHQQVEQITHG
ncbi:MAG: hypothetical protein Q8922_07400 [Bacteroidota bacterium]|nr:hypothetical protein [Bacteroidota bacterium]MDP4233561.1 hypothetical protein [Bacteroidota bacterium]MDP4243664.1 hypothetical protein [Bacteroidota bacterium]MDP4287747.1 hypothetical protein [Bacteroidota bacterium]